MRDDDLKQLLTRAETDLPAHLPATSDTVRGVQRRFAARQRRRHAMTGASVAVLLVAIGWRFLPLHDDSQFLTTQLAELDVERELNDLRRLQAETDSELRVLHRMLQLERLARQRAEVAAELAALNGGPTIAEQRDEVAYRMILQADALTEMMQPSEQAAGIYRRVLDLYPTTHSAELARERLEKLGVNGGNI